MFSIVKSNGFGRSAFPCSVLRLLVTFLVAEIKCQAGSSLTKGFILVGGATYHYGRESTGWGGGREAEGEGEGE